MESVRDGVNRIYLVIARKGAPSNTANFVTVPKIDMLIHKGTGFCDSFLDFEAYFPEAFVYGLLDSILDLKQIELGDDRVTPLIRRSWFDIRVAVTEALVDKARSDLDNLDQSEDN